MGAGLGRNGEKETTDGRGQEGRAPTSRGCCSRNAGCPPGSRTVRRAPRPPQGSSWGSAPPSAPMPPRPPAREGGVRPLATRKARPLPARGVLPTASHQPLQLPESEGEEVDVGDAAENKFRTSACPAPGPAATASLRGVARVAGRARGPTCGRGWRRPRSRPAGPRRRRQPARPARQGAAAPAARKPGSR